MEKIKIGADELILWLRKNEKATDISNQRLGKEIHDLIAKRLNGELIQEDAASHWENSGKSIHEFNLPKTSAQYKMDASQLKDIFLTLNSW